MEVNHRDASASNTKIEVPGSVNLAVLDEICLCPGPEVTLGAGKRPLAAVRALHVDPQNGD